MAMEVRRQRRGRCLSGALLLMAASTASALPGGHANEHWPKPVAHFIARSEICLHFAGEFGGNGSPRDAEVNRETDKLRCDSLPTDLRTLRQRYRNDARISARLAAFDEDGLPKDADAGE